jgi:integrase
MPKPLSPAFLRSLKQPAPGRGQVEHVDGGCAGLRLRLSAGSASWSLGCRDQTGRLRRFTLGRFPDMGLAAAREAARRLRVEVRDGRDPVAERRARHAAGRHGLGRPVTLADVIGNYEALVGHTRRSWAAARKMVEHVFAAKLARPAIEITSAELQLVVDRHTSRASAGAAVRYLKPILRWAVKRELVSAGVAAIDQPEGAQGRRDRVLTHSEIHSILAVLDSEGAHGDCLRWIFWSGCRLGEAVSARWDDVTDGIWTIPTTKTGRPHGVPLPVQALASLQRLEHVGDLIFVGNSGGHLVNWTDVTRRLQKRSGTAGWHRHDIRRTAATLMGELGIAPHVIEVALGHALRTSSDGTPLGNVAGIYNRSRYRAEHADALQRLADELDRIAAGGGDNVVRLRA